MKPTLHHQTAAEVSVWLYIYIFVNTLVVHMIVMQSPKNWRAHNFLHIKMCIHILYTCHLSSRSLTWFPGSSNIGFWSLPLGHGPATEITNIQKIAEREEGLRWAKVMNIGRIPRSCPASNSLVPKTVVVPTHFLRYLLQIIAKNGNSARVLGNHPHFWKDLQLPAFFSW